MSHDKPQYKALPVLGTRELRTMIPSMLDRFRKLGPKAPPVFFGARRRPEGVLLPYGRYEEMLEELDNAAIVTLVEARLPRAEAQLGDDLDVVASDLGFDPAELAAT